MEYSYPIDLSWTQEEMVIVVEYLSMIEQAYENKVDAQLFKAQYQQFKQVVPGKAEENNIYKEFKQASSYDGYYAVKQLKEQMKANHLTFISVKS